MDRGNTAKAGIRKVNIMQRVYEQYEQVFDWAVLENGHRIDSTGTGLRVGDVWMTQWGPRKIVKIHRDVIDTRATEPHGV